jgi:hypothetical protein
MAFIQHRLVDLFLEEDPLCSSFLRLKSFITEVLQIKITRNIFAPIFCFTHPEPYFGCVV